MKDIKILETIQDFIRTLGEADFFDNMIKINNFLGR